MFKKIKYLILSIIFLIMIFCAYNKVIASDAAGLIISPPLKEKTASAGESYTDVIKITNPIDGTLKIKTTVADFKAKGESGGQEFINPEDDNSAYALGKWITIEPEFSLKKDETKEIPYTVNVPKDAEPGGHYGVIFFQPTTLENTQVSGSGAVVLPKIGSLLLITVPGDIKYEAKIEEFTTNKKIYFNTNNIINFISRIQNLGNTHIKPQGDIIISNTFGKNIATLTVNENQGNVLPQSIRKFENELEKKHGFGWYTAKINLKYGDNQSLAGRLIFWIIPWKETLGAIFAILIIIFIVKKLEWKKDKK